MKKVAIIKIMGCKEPTVNGGALHLPTGTGGGCPYKCNYGFEPGCVFCYGELPEKGFPEWCPLDKTDE